MWCYEAVSEVLRVTLAAEERQPLRSIPAESVCSLGILGRTPYTSHATRFVNEETSTTLEVFEVVTKPSRNTFVSHKDT